MEETKKDILNQGLADELNAAAEYIGFAASFGDIALKERFLQYASDELNHALKILRLMQNAKVEPEKIAITPIDGELIEELVQYIANEEAAVFYYDVLQKLHQDGEVTSLCQEIKNEEDRHLRNIRQIFLQAKERKG